MVKNSVFFEIINNKKIFCYLSETDPSQKNIVIMNHGFKGTSVGPAREFVDFSRLLNKEGFSTLRFDQPNSGNSYGDYIDISFNEWINAIIYFAKKYLDRDHKVALLGQSMGATASVIATNNPNLKNKIPLLLLWVPDPKSDVNIIPNQVYEEEGQKYKGSFWKEAKDAGFFKCLDEYRGIIHLVYGEEDRFINQEIRNQIVKKVETKGGHVMILKGENHSPWKYNISQEVYTTELKLLKEA